MSTLALPAPSKARTRQRNNNQMLRKLRALKWRTTIFDVPHPETRLWMVVITWHRADAGKAITASTVAAVTKKQAVRLHKEATFRQSPYLKKWAAKVQICAPHGEMTLA